MLNVLKQLAYPKEWRIGPTFTDSSELAKRLNKLENLLEKSPVLEAPFIVAIATEVWRTRRRFVRFLDITEDKVKKVDRSLKRIEKVLKENEIQIIDREGGKYDVGMADIEVIGSEPRENIKGGEEIILETIDRPTIFWKDRLINKGKVIIGVSIEERRQEI